jgi:hypothetical protein
MKRFFITSLGLILSALVFTSCSSITGASAESNEELYKAAIERYYNSIFHYDVDALLDSLDPIGLIYPDAATIEELRATTNETALHGEALVKDLTILEESATRAKVKVTLFLSVDFDNNGEFDEETYYPTFELTFKDGIWRIFNVTVE